LPSGEIAEYLNQVGLFSAIEANQREQKINKAGKIFIQFDVYLNNNRIKLLI
jgi:hypothetical protein